MCGGIAKLLLFVSGALTHGPQRQEVGEASYEGGYMRPGRLGAAGGPWARSSTTRAHLPDKSAEWIVSLRTSLMRDNYDYQPAEPEALAPLTSEASDSSGDTSDQHGPSAQDYDRPTPRSLNHNSKDSFRARHDNALPSRPVNQNISRKHMYRDKGLQLPTVPVPESRGPALASLALPPRGRALASLTMPPRTAQNAALIDEINEQFDAKRRNYLESLYELEDQLRPVYAGGSPRREVVRGQQSADRRGGDERGIRNHLDDGIGVKPDSLPYIGHDGIKRYKVFTNEIEKFQPFVEDYLDYRNNHNNARIPFHKNPKNQDPLTELHQEALKMMDNVTPTFDESTEYLKDRKPRPSGRETTKGDEWYTRRHSRRTRKKQRSMYLESAGLPDIDSEGSVQRNYTSRRHAELED